MWASFDVGYWGERQYQWGPASSPVIGDGLVFVQNDRQEDSFLAPLTTSQRVKSGGALSSTRSPPGARRFYIAARAAFQLVTNVARTGTVGNDPRTGEELWRVSHENSQVITPSMPSSQGIALS